MSTCIDRLVVAAVDPVFRPIATCAVPRCLLVQHRRDRADAPPDWRRPRSAIDVRSWRRPRHELAERARRRGRPRSSVSRSALEADANRLRLRGHRPSYGSVSVDDEHAVRAVAVRVRRRPRRLDSWRTSPASSGPASVSHCRPPTCSRRSVPAAPRIRTVSHPPTSPRSASSAARRSDGGSEQLAAQSSSSLDEPEERCRAPAVPWPPRRARSGRIASSPRGSCARTERTACASRATFTAPVGGRESERSPAQSSPRLAMPSSSCATTPAAHAPQRAASRRDAAAARSSARAAGPRREAEACTSSPPSCGGVVAAPIHSRAHAASFFQKGRLQRVDGSFAGTT